MEASSKKVISSTLADLIRIFWAPAILFGLHLFIFFVLSAYILVPWLDIPMHYLGGLVMAYSLFLALVFFQQNGTISQLDKGIELLLVFTLVATIAVFWEFGEFTIDLVFGVNVQTSLQNTMQDLFLGLLGVSSLIGYKIVRNRKQAFWGKNTTRF
jgi:hypothetical protein